MRILLVLQGEGRGHQTQALAFAQMAQKNGHEILAAVVSTPDLNKIPTLLKEQANFPIIPLQSPGLGYTPSHRLSLTKTLGLGLLYIPQVVRSLDKLHRLFLSSRPDWVVNFYEPLWGLYAGIYRPQVKTTAIAHQYLLLDPQFPFPSGRKLEKNAVLALTRLTAWRAEDLWGLSFTPWETTAARLRPIPPLLREEIRLTPPPPYPQNYWLAYFTQPAFIQDLIRWSLDHPEQPIHVFGQYPPASPLPTHVKWHPISATHFVEKLRHCQALVTTAGFESIAEAHFLGKPVYAIPLPGHYEQACNAQDWARTGGGLTDDRLDLSRFQQWLQQNPNPKASAWHSTAISPELRA